MGYRKYPVRHPKKRDAVQGNEGSSVPGWQTARGVAAHGGIPRTGWKGVANLSPCR